MFLGTDKKSPLHLAEDEQARDTTSFYRPKGQPQTDTGISSRCNGRSRHCLLYWFSKPLRKVFNARCPLPRTTRQLSLEQSARLLGFFPAFECLYIIYYHPMFPMSTPFLPEKRGFYGHRILSPALRAARRECVPILERSVRSARRIGPVCEILLPCDQQFHNSVFLFTFRETDCKMGANGSFARTLKIIVDSFCI